MILHEAISWKTIITQAAILVNLALVGASRTVEIGVNNWSKKISCSDDRDLSIKVGVIKKPLHVEELIGEQCKLTIQASDRILNTYDGYFVIKTTKNLCLESFVTCHIIEKYFPSKRYSHKKDISLATVTITYIPVSKKTSSQFKNSGSTRYNRKLHQDGEGHENDNFKVQPTEIVAIIVSSGVVVALFGIIIKAAIVVIRKRKACNRESCTVLQRSQNYGSQQYEEPGNDDPPPKYDDVEAPPPRYEDCVN